MKVYKLVRGCDEALYSLMYNLIDTPLRKFSCRYGVECTTYPLIGKLFAFDTLQAAQEYADRFGPLWDVKIYEAEAEGVTKPPRRIAYSDLAEMFEAVWNGGLTEADYSQLPPDGTVVCDSIKLVERVYG